MLLICNECGYKQNVKGALFFKHPKLMGVCNICKGISMPDMAGVVLLKEIHKAIKNTNGKFNLSDIELMNIKEQCIKRKAIVSEKINGFIRG